MFGQIKLIYNKDAETNAKPVYNAICVMDERGQYETLLMTEYELQRVRSRAVKNPEDTISLAWFARAVLWVLKGLRIL